MKITLSLRTVFFAFVVASVGFGSSVLGADGAPKQNALQIWKGTASDESPVSVFVMEGAVISVNLFVVGGRGVAPEKSLLISFTGEAKIADGKFKFTSSASTQWGNAETVVTGTFRSPTNLSGTATIKPPPNLSDSAAKNLTFQAVRGG